MHSSPLTPPPCRLIAVAAALALCASLVVLVPHAAAQTTPVVTVTADYSRVYESQTAVFTFHADPAPAADLVVNYTIRERRDGVRNAGDTGVAKTVTIKAGQSSASVSIPAAHRLRYTANFAGDGTVFSCQNNKKYTDTANSIVYEVMPTPAQTFPAWKSDQTYREWKATNSQDPAPAPASQVSGHWLYKEIVDKGTYATNVAKWEVYDEVSWKCTLLKISTDMGEIRVLLSSGSGYTLASAQTAKTDVRDKSLKDSDGIEANFGATTYALVEGSSDASERTVTIPVTLAEAHASSDLTVNYTISGTAAVPLASTGNGADYTIRPAPTGSITITQGTTSADLTVSVVNDIVVEGDETIVLELQSGTGTYPGGARTATITITDDDAAPTTMALSVSPTTVAEDAGQTSVAVTAAFPAASAVFAENKTVAVSVAGSGLSNRVGFTAVADFDITIAAGARTATGSFNLSPTDDSNDNDDETVTVSGTLAGVTVASATLTIADDEVPPPPPAVRFGAAAYSGGEASGSRSVSVVVLLSAAAPSSTTIRYTATGSATPGSDYTRLPGTVVAAKGATSVAIPVAILDDSADDDSETIVLRLMQGSGYTLGSPTQTVIAITDDDTTVIEQKVKQQQEVGSQNPTPGYSGGYFPVPIVLPTVEVEVEQEEAQSISSGETAQFLLAFKGQAPTGVKLYLNANSDAEIGTDYQIHCQFPDEEEWVSLGSDPLSLLIDAPTGTTKVFVRITSNLISDPGSETPIAVTISDRSFLPGSALKLEASGQADIVLTGTEPEPNQDDTDTGSTDQDDTDSETGTGDQDDSDTDTGDQDDSDTDTGDQDDTDTGGEETDSGADSTTEQASPTEQQGDSPSDAATYLNYTVRLGDTLESIAQAAYRDTTAWQRIFDANQGRTFKNGFTLTDADSIRYGWILRLPAPLAAPAANPRSHATYTVQQGDTLGAIAQKVYGDAAHYPRIEAANMGRHLPGGAVFTNGDLIMAGWVLRVPLAA